MSNSKKYELSDVRVASLTLESKLGGNKADIRGQVISFSVYEDMFEPTVYAEFIVVDSINFISRFPVVGEETLTVTFVSPYRNKETTYTLKVFSVASTVIAQTSKASAYIIRAVSEEHFLGANSIINNAYKDSVSNVVIDIFRNKMKSKKTLAVEETKGIVDLIVPRTQGLQAIDFCKQRAVGKSKMGGVYVFFENQYGFQFKSIESIISEEKNVPENRYFRALPGTRANDKSRTFEFRNLIRHEHLSSFDSYNKAQSGAISNKVKVFDLKTKTFEDIEFKLSEQKSNIPFTSSKSVINSSDDFLATNEAGGARFMMPTDSGRSKEYLPEMFGYKSAFFTIFNENIVRCHVHGDNQLAAGMMIKLYLPDPTAVKSDVKYDELHSGNYLITRLRHLFYLEDSKFKHNVTFDCNKIGLKL